MTNNITLYYSLGGNNNVGITNQIQYLAWFLDYAILLEISMSPIC